MVTIGRRLSVERMMKRILHSLACALALLSDSVAAPPQVINHQGRIAVGGTNFDGSGHFKFALVDASGTVLMSVARNR